MGCCAATPESSLDAKIAREIYSDKGKLSRVQKLLFLGSGGSGKSTFFKQLKCIHGRGFSQKDRRIFREHISNQIIEQMIRAIDCIPFVNESIAEQFEPLELSPNALKSADFIQDLDIETLIDAEIGDHIAILWAEDAIKTVFENRSVLKISDSSSYFFSEIDRIASGNYLPTDSDILLVRYRTTGVVESEFHIKGSTFHIYDVGGQKSERKKWIHCFENVTAVIYVASLSSYDELMFEDDGINAMADSLDLFAEICDNQWFVTTPIILFLNKNDLFVEKIKQVPITVCFADYDGADALDADLCKEFITRQYQQRNKYAKRSLHIHRTTATDKNNVLMVFSDVQQFIVQQGLERNNLL